MSTEQRCGKGSGVISPSIQGEWSLSPLLPCSSHSELSLQRISKYPVLGISVDREPARSVSCPPAAFPPATLSLEPPNSLFYWYQLYGPCSGTPLGPPAGFLAHLPAVALSVSALGAVASCGVGAHGGQPLDRPILLGLGLEVDWGRFSWYLLTLGPYKIGCSQPHYFNKSGAILM